MAMHFQCYTKVLLIIFFTLCILMPEICARREQLLCGKRKTKIKPLISKGTPTQQEDWPWHAALYHNYDNKFVYVCGGSVISANTVLTAAHCVYVSGHLMQTDKMQVQVGRQSLNDTSASIQVLSILEVIVHHEFHAHSLDHDIAIVKLKSNILMARPVCLWTMEDEKIEDKIGSVVGFGKTERGVLSDSLYQANLTVVDTMTCLESDRASLGPILTRNMYCAGGTQGTNACNGDSGGGMFFDKSSTWYVRGIVSFIAKQSSDATCDLSKYTVFTDIAKYREWLLRFTNVPRGLNNLERCKDRSSSKDAMCNMALHFDHDFLLVGHDQGITRMPTNGGEGFRIVTNSRVQGLDRDCSDGRIYWSDSSMQIYTAKYDGTDRKPFIAEDIGLVPDVAVDWISRRLYWFDAFKNAIEVASLDNPNVRTVLITNVNYPCRIAVDPYQGMLYWTRSSDQEHEIMWSNLDGTEQHRLVGGSDFRLPKKMQVSMASGELCYTDEEMGRIDCIDTYSRDNRTVARRLEDPSALAITEDAFYWTKAVSNDVNSVNQNGVDAQSVKLSDTTYFIETMTAVSDKCPQFYSPCARKNGDCPYGTICLLNPHAAQGKHCSMLRGV